MRQGQGWGLIGLFAGCTSGAVVGDIVVSEPDEGTDAATPAPAPAPRPNPDVGDAVVCYLGADRQGDTCVDAISVRGLPNDYDYPPPLNGSLQYAAPDRYLDLLAIDPSLRLAPNFRLDEFAETRIGRYAVVQPHAVSRLQAVRDVVGAIVVNSGYRHPDYNARIGGATWSRHMYGDGFDLDPRSASLQELGAECESRGADFVSVYETHVHCDWRSDALEPAFFVERRSLQTLTVLPALDAQVEVDGGQLVARAEGFDEGEPLREWTGFDDDGGIVASFVGRRWAPPDEVVRVEVLVGGAVQASWERW